ncbi:hypothetical protein EF847_09680 [Actinobacteria bacterium YIM 96077]|uniref:DUF3137 domain-containing protein n=1 Tax=Phytoactinopolyspora halophila TaxID=1981511 RepID=A0A329QMP6_9ACTN|nr:hypothetical protein [Phytoactinopolyspora halophila]AYY12937.1 hypothetical protein EF847_09680 [Actinobacteria bacterium YIM 96077]RAW13201.1 hypothetical protein DPM12_12705 [Phytoactinopolyspora halophila]
MEGGIILVVIGLAVAAAVVWNRRMHQRRKQDIRELAMSYGWHWVERNDNLTTRWSGPPFRDVGRDMKARDVVSGEYRGRPFTAFQYSYTMGPPPGPALDEPQSHPGSARYTGNELRGGGGHAQAGRFGKHSVARLGRGRSTSTFHHRVFVIELPLSLPPISLGPEGLLGGRLARAFGFDRVETGDSFFDNQYKVVCPDPDFARSLLHPEMVRLLARSGTWSWRIEGDVMLSYSRGYMRATLVQRQLDAMCDVLDLIPGDVWHTYGVP